MNKNQKCNYCNDKATCVCVGCKSYYEENYLCDFHSNTNRDGTKYCNGCYNAL